MKIYEKVWKLLIIVCFRKSILWADWGEHDTLLELKHAICFQQFTSAGKR